MFGKHPNNNCIHAFLIPALSEKKKKEKKNTRIHIIDLNIELLDKYAIGRKKKQHKRIYNIRARIH